MIAPASGRWTWEHNDAKRRLVLYHPLHGAPLQNHGITRDLFCPMPDHATVLCYGSIQRVVFKRGLIIVVCMEHLRG